MLVLLAGLGASGIILQIEDSLEIVASSVVLGIISSSCHLKSTSLFAQRQKSANESKNDHKANGVDCEKYTCDGEE